MEKAIEHLSTAITNFLGDLFKGLGGGVGSALMSALAIGGFFLTRGKSKSTYEVEKFAEEVQSSEAVRGVVAGPTNVAISKVGESLKFALATTEVLLTRIAIAVEGGTTTTVTGGTSAPGASFRLSTSTPT